MHHSFTRRPRYSNRSGPCECNSVVNVPHELATRVFIPSAVKLFFDDAGIFMKTLLQVEKTPGDRWGNATHFEQYLAPNYSG